MSFTGTKVTHKTRALVFEALSNSKQNGYFDPGYQHHGAIPLDIATDLVRCAADLEVFEPTDLVPLVEAWLVQNDFLLMAFTREEWRLIAVACGRIKSEVFIESAAPDAKKRLFGIAKVIAEQTGKPRA